MLNEKDLQQRLGQLLLTLWSLDQALTEAREQLAALQPPAEPTKEATPE